jgi:hypothetical protein
VRNSLAASSGRAYLFDLAHFEAWGGRIPCDPQLVASYLADHAGKLAVATLVRRLAAITREIEAIFNRNNSHAHPGPTTMPPRYLTRYRAGLQELLECGLQCRGFTPSFPYVTASDHMHGEFWSGKHSVQGTRPGELVTRWLARFAPSFSCRPM